MRCSVIWLKSVTLISLLLMNMCRADITLSEVESTLNFEIATDSSQVVINPEGPLNFLRGYIYQRMECMYNKRFFSPQINIEYELEEYAVESVTNTGYLYVREEKRDRAYTAQSTNKMDVYAEKYHNHLIELFPSPTGDITIETRGNQSFVQFLRAETTEKHALQILAILLLFSEGVNIPIKVTNTVLEVYEKDKKDEIYFKVPMAVPWLNPATDKAETFQQKKVKQMISFFKENSVNREVLSMMVDECSYDEFATGKFLDSPKFLIQSYIFGFIDTAQRAIEFIQTVHEMTEKYAPKTEATSKDNSVYNRLFKPAGTMVNTRYMRLLKKSQQIMARYKVFPFTDKTQLPAYKSVPYYTRKNKSFSFNRLERYSNCVECMILSLFCCLAYDPAKGIYRTDHMGHVSEELEEFFSLKNQPFDTTKDEFQRKWCKVVADLKEPSIAYCRKRNEIDTGLINMLMVIAEVINAPREEKDKILGFSEELKGKISGLDYKLYNEIKEYTKALVKRLSNTENVEIHFSGLNRTVYNNGRSDVSGQLTITFEYKSITNRIVLGIEQGHGTIDMKPAIMKIKDDRIEKMNEIADYCFCKNEGTFIENLFAAYVAYEIRKIDSPQKTEEFMKAQVRRTIQNNHIDINRLLLIKKIRDLDYKAELLTCYIAYTMDQNLSKTHPVVRFTSNILGSTELDNWEIQLRILSPIVFATEYKKRSGATNYPRIQLTEDLRALVEFRSNLKNFIGYILDCNVDIFMIWLRMVISQLGAGKGMHSNPLLIGSVNRNITRKIFKDGSMEYANEINEIFGKAYPEYETKMKDRMHFIWLTYLCAEENLNLELIKINFHAICNYKFILERYIFCIESRQVCLTAIQTLGKLMDKLCHSESDMDKINRLINILG
ncbi:hypothetical protein NEAUS04_0194 [Nematocida ausubeli]|uniref:Uncharacterized protein n=1 Tax=Nematocida ausubeli (strain ATCC PRA-371 / ERTm2) TaxID=1913371 RepID=A0A086IYY7_NEMA1|nr:uncharacterized protein NESG_02427 [Nematocida ausubeli]KAI5132293.1 hypothetical protein NEAUS06_0082 [Nematocida ausubeli]KAI5133574.1 hypothetical protein NEAUS07_0468 [Nematocida ausubeli]KAI5147174.1 hypothetical protein NEAUS05_0496 [Nematocida ausubeli]KAI5160861.1 hypothetical protein NEAUS04_0194 [Nematocida ausubeli]KFG25105.1 hypothetical protein NESG_02427 [Nematocida ausubeli]